MAFKINNQGLGYNYFWVAGRFAYQMRTDKKRLSTRLFFFFYAELMSRINKKAALQGTVWCSNIKTGI